MVRIHLFPPDWLQPLKSIDFDGCFFVLLISTSIWDFQEKLKLYRSGNGCTVSWGLLCIYQNGTTVCDGQDNDTLIYDFMKKVFTERGDNRRLKNPEDCVEHLDDDKVLCRDWPSFVYLVHDAGGGSGILKRHHRGINYAQISISVWRISSLVLLYIY